MRLRILLVMTCVLSSPLLAQKDTIFIYKGIQAKLHYGFIFAHSEAVQNTAGAHPRGIEVELIKQRNDTATWDLCHCYPTKGWNFSYFDFNTPILGQGITAAYFLQPSYKIGREGQFLFRGGMGLSYLTRPYNVHSNPTNISYSTNLSGFLQVGVGGSYRLAPRLLLLLMGQYQHVSNGGFKDPNKGINWPTASVGLRYFTRQYRLQSYPTARIKDNLKRKPITKRGYFLSPTRHKIWWRNTTYHFGWYFNSS